jgi:hypothetical protein
VLLYIVFHPLESRKSHFFDENSQQARRLRKAQEKVDRRRLHDRIEREWSNFEHIREKCGYKREGHRRAVEDVSIELAVHESEKIRSMKRYRKFADRALAESSRIANMPSRQKDVSRLLPLLENLK